MNLSFCGCGFLGIYHLGVAQALINHGPRLLNKVEKVAGASAGALVAVAIVCNPDKLAESKVFSLELARNFRSLKQKPPSLLLPSIKTFLKASIPEDGYMKARGRLYVSLTNFNYLRRKHEIVTNFTSNNELVEAVLLSCTIPGYTSSLKTLSKNMVLDGGFSNNLYIFDEGRTITVAPFFGNFDICPQNESKLFNIGIVNMKVAVNGQNLKRARHGIHPPPESGMQNYFAQGYADSVNFLKKENFYEDSVNKENV